MRCKYIVYGILLLAVTIAGCSKDFLNRSALDAITSEQFWKTEPQLKMAVNACYDYLKGKNVVDMENMGDNTIYPPLSDYQNISTGNFDFTLNTLNNEWVNQYKGIRRCNHFLENYQKAEGIREATLKQYAGEARFLRAFLYSYLTFFFGDVPLVTNTLNIGDEQVYGPRTPRLEVVDFILQQLDSAAAELPLSYGAADLGRITKGAALGWKSRVALFYGRYDVAEAAAKAVMDLNVYQLYDNGNTATSYNELFSHKGKLAAGANKETILARLYLLNVSMHNMSREAQVPDQTSRFNPTKSLIDAYLCTDGRPVDKSPLYNEAAQTAYADVFKNRDPRMVQTILAPGSTWGGKDDGDADANPSDIYNLPKFNSDKKGSVTATGYYFTKYVEVSAVATYNKDPNDIHIMRYAEILLNYAEAREMQGKLTQADLDMTINLLRDRVGMHHIIMTELASWGMDLREEIRRERRVELALEGQRYFDLLRWKKGALLAEDVKGMKKSFIPDYMQPYVAGVAVDAKGYMIINTNRRFVDPKNYLWPVPLTQVQRNVQLGQNPGWE
ncbi:RagB/SusD family nutrient uptake outer membrane protein [Chitinophaga rhizophila]|uniref:RagB/SusD family nutrient uptake outer membrane protein n=1 Tax=Chitinophaga rhizophila TaxID=2866212 RepID=A0ABS7GFF5_9BACT|nr:RagB/SusD family nutrient uptake outer membrane protein [Chitinophaga rhizophila]MBW8686419.1 RagB/SusD family nutrient uptake outer membrane protein [Chitinophaga rhizophila]